MKQKYAIIRDDEQKTLIIREYAELDKEMMSLLCEETYSQERIAEAVKKGILKVVDAIRTNNMYPPTLFAEPIAQAIISLFSDGGNLSAELFFDDKELFNKVVEKEIDDVEEVIDEDVAVDELLDDDIDEEFDDGDEVLTDLKSSLQVSDEDGADIEDVG
jgi:actin-like ATPase involved in cell morphogenesis